MCAAQKDKPRSYHFGAFCVPCAKEKLPIRGMKVMTDTNYIDDEFNPEYMRRAIELAKRGTGAVNPNPLVGAVIVKDGRVIGEGYHARYGELHAERSAFASLKNPAEAEGAVMYVTLEPCCHYGKQPPCAAAIIEHKIRKIYCGSDDPNAKVAGKGFEWLREAGIEVHTHCLKEECDAINDVFFKYIVDKKPYVALKYAMTMDGKIATRTGESKWITSGAARAYVMELRNKYKGIMVGIGTVLADDPMLTCRIEPGAVRDNDNQRNPVRIVCDSRLRIPEDSALVRTANEVPTIVAVTEAGAADREKCERLEAAGVDVLLCRAKGDTEQVDIDDLLCKLGGLGIDGILLEGGGRLAYSAVAAGVVDEVDAFVAPKVFGGSGVYTPVSGTGVEHPADAYMYELCEVRNFAPDVLLRYRKKVKPCLPA